MHTRYDECDDPDVCPVHNFAVALDQQLTTIQPGEAKMDNRIIEVTPEAQEIATFEQWGQLGYLLGAVEKIKVFVDFSLPEGYLGVILTYPLSGDIYGGIDPEGVLST